MNDILQGQSVRKPDRAESIITEAVEVASEQLRAQFDCGAEKCESPIERIFLAQFLHPQNGIDVVQAEVLTPPSGELKDVAPPPVDGLYIWPQIKIGPYRVDFICGRYMAGTFRCCVVECDGHDFHERTKEQAARDKSRDRALSATGLHVLRFTGSEIYNSPENSVAEVLDFLCRASGL